SAMREADNSSAIVDLIREETGVNVEVISGRREAGLIFAAIRGSLALEPGPAVCFDLGGGSLEVMVGDNAGLLWSASVHLGVARLSAQFIEEDPPTAGELRRLKARITEVLTPVAAEVASFEPKLMVGTSGTFLDLARMAVAARTGAAPQSVNQLATARGDLQQVHDRLIGLPAGSRAKLPGLDGRRADQIPVGSLVLMTAMKLFGFDELMVGEWALREGIVLDAIRHHEVAEWTNDGEAIRRSAVLGLARRCNVDEGHATQVARLATTLFEQTLSLHHLPISDRELLEHAAWLHDIGEHVAVESHHKHTAYLIEHGKLRGFSPDDVGILATLGRYHRRNDPKASFDPFGRLPVDRRNDALALLSLLRLADGLDRGHAATVDEIDVEISPTRVRLLVTSRGDMDLEVWGVRRKRELFERLFERKLDVVAADHPSLAARA
ncbi:MAG: Ppx/GppA family phosphatase, partial [Actinomycetota bacterium]|nr:Ppx/GppA family phosphatase [Actinomycetota bacterium]